MELLFDDLWIDRKSGVRRVLGTVFKEAAPVIGSDMPWEERVHGSHAVLFDPEAGKYKLWYRAYVYRKKAKPRREDVGVETSEQDSGEQRTFICCAESEDGLTWARPDLGLVDFRGSRANNIMTEIDRGDSVFWNIVRDPDDPDPARRYKGLGFNHGGKSNIRGIADGGNGVYVQYSPDGIHWPGERVMIMDTRELTDADCILPCREPTTGKWVGFFRPRTAPKRRFIGYSESADFDHWTYPRMLLTPDEGDDEWIEFYGMTVAVVGRWRIGCLWVYHNNPEFSPMTVELVYSRDGLHYHRAMPGEQFIPNGPDGSFDSRMICGMSVLPVGDELFVYYTGTNREHGSDRFMEMQEGRFEGGEERYGIGLARVPGMNFCGLRADFDGMVETKWLCNYDHGGVQAYADIDPDGWLRCELLDQYGRVTPGYDRDRSRVRRADDGRLRFSWGGDEFVGTYGEQREGDAIVGHVVKLRFHLHKATLYGFQAGTEDAMPDYKE